MTGMFTILHPENEMLFSLIVTVMAAKLEFKTWNLNFPYTLAVTWVVVVVVVVVLI